MTSQPRIGLIVGSTRPVRVGGPTAQHLIPRLREAGAEPVLLDLAEIQLPLLNEALPPSSGVRNEPHTIAWGEAISNLDGVIFLTPEYNHGYPAALKNAIDSLYTEWQNLPGALISYGWSGGSLAADQLRPVLQFIGINLQGEGVQMPFQPTDFDDAMRLVSPEQFVARHEEELAEVFTAVVQAALEGREAEALAA